MEINKISGLICTVQSLLSSDFFESIAHILHEENPISDDKSIASLVASAIHQRDHDKTILDSDSGIESVLIMNYHSEPTIWETVLLHFLLHFLLYYPEINALYVVGSWVIRSGV